MCPSGDRTSSVANNRNTYYLTNMVPQSDKNNTGPWESLESYERDLATAGKELFIISGGVFGPFDATIGNGVEVPESTFKVIVVLDSRGQGAADVTVNTRVIAIDIPNRDSQVNASDDWRKYRVTPRAIESMTGLNLLSDVPQAVQDVVENQLDTQ